MDKHDDETGDNYSFQEQYFFMEDSDIWLEFLNQENLENLHLKFVANLEEVKNKNRVVVCRIVDRSRVQPVFIMYLTSSGAEFIKQNTDQLFLNKPYLEFPEIKFEKIPEGNFGPIGPTARTPEALFFEKYASPVNSPSLDLITCLNLSCSEITDEVLDSHRWAMGCLKVLAEHDANLSTPRNDGVTPGITSRFILFIQMMIVSVCSIPKWKSGMFKVFGRAWCQLINSNE